MTTVGDDHVLAMLVTDDAGAPVPGVDVEIREQGPATFADGADSTIVTTGPDGRATASLTATEGGGSSVWAELRSEVCGSPESCVAGPLTIHWEEEPPSWPACADGQDNDGNGLQDFPDDPGCTSPEDESEGHGDPIEVHWPRAVRLNLVDWAKADRGETRERDRRRLVVFGRLTLPQGGPQQCLRDMPVEIARRVDGAWVHVKRATTNEDGWYVTVLRDRAGRYRATVPRRRARLDDGSAPVCRRGIRIEAHRHRG